MAERKPPGQSRQIKPGAGGVGPGQLHDPHIGEVLTEGLVPQREVAHHQIGVGADGERATAIAVIHLGFQCVYRLDHRGVQSQLNRPFGCKQHRPFYSVE